MKKPKEKIFDDVDDYYFKYYDVDEVNIYIEYLEQAMKEAKEAFNKNYEESCCGISLAALKWIEEYSIVLNNDYE